MKFKQIAAAALFAVASIGANAATVYADTSVDSVIGVGGLDIGDLTFGSLSDVSVTFDMWSQALVGYGLPSSMTISLLPAGSGTPTQGASNVGNDPMFGLISGSYTNFAINFTGVAAGSYDIIATGNDGGNKLVFTNVATSVTAVPEPESYAMMLAGLGALGFMARRRKAK